MTSDRWLGLLVEVVAAIKEALAGFERWGEAGDIPGQYALDLVADKAALEVLRSAGVNALTEESGFVVGGSESEFVVIVDPVDGSTNASRRVPYYSTSLCVLSNSGFEVGLVEDLTAGTKWWAVAGEGAWCDGRRLSLPAQQVPLHEALVVCNGIPPATIRSGQTRVLGSAALDLCGVASGRFDAFVDPQRALRAWDYAAGVLICREAGAVVEELGGEQFEHTDERRRLGPLAAVGSGLAAELKDALAS